MARVREVVIEIMRHGPPHNQLLSPTTRYLALCGAHPAVTLKIPKEHQEVVHLLSRMADEPGAAARHHYERRDLQNLVTSLLAQMPALPNETRARADTLVHLRLTMTAQELSLLPFELAGPPPGISHSRQPLLIGPEPDVLLTREVRRSARPDFEVPVWFKALVVASDPEDLGLPLSDTLEVFEEVLAPFGWPGLFEGRLVPGLANQLVTVLVDASLDDVRERCHLETYSHIHFLAHGAELKGRSDAFGIALWDREKVRTEVVDGEALARAVMPPQADGGWSRPWCVTLATCDSARQEAIPLVPQTSLAHALHEAGIPTVIASQYPLTFGAAVEMTRALYEGELRGDDIRFTLRSMRHRIASRMRTTYDWASLATYASWPDNLGAQSDKLRSLRIVQALEVANNWADTAVAFLENGSDRQAHEAAGHTASQRLADIIPRLEDEAERILEAREETQLQQDRRNTHWFNRRHERDVAQAGAGVLYVDLCGLLGSAWKRRARLRELLGEGDAAVLDALRQSAYWYARGTEIDRRTHWTACQACVMQALLSRCGASSEATWKNWRLARDRAVHDLDLDRSAAIWAHSTLVEIELWSECFDQGAGHPERHLKQLLELTPASSFPIHATRRQLLRYRDWWFKADYTPGVDQAMVERVEELLEYFPPVDEKRVEVRELDSASLLDGLEPPPELDANTQLGADQMFSVHFDSQQPDENEPFFHVQMLPARGGDALWIEYGQGEETHRILIDGGYRKTIQSVRQRIRDIARKEGGVCRFELVVVTHVDTDHIEGIIELLGTELPIEIGDIWFNGREHLRAIKRRPPKPTDPLSGKHGLFLDNLIRLLEARWNGAFGGDPVVLPKTGAPPVVTLPGGMKLTLLSPTQGKLDELAPDWDRHVRKAKLDKATVDEVLEAMAKLHYTTEAVRPLGRKKPSGPVEMKDYLTVSDSPDTGTANGASIAFLAEYAGRSALFTGDAHADVLIESIERLMGKRKRLPVGAVKLPHHGSKNNVSQALLRKLETQTFLVSTSGGGHYHPDREAIARVVAGKWRSTAKTKAKVRLLFNYLSAYNKIWNDEQLMEKYAYEAHYPHKADVLQLASVPEPP
ncbi:MAG: CHAT domain-containing protein [Acidobacteriota bacterium]